MPTGVEQSLANVFVAVHTPRVSSEIADSLLKELHASEITVTLIDQEDEHGMVIADMVCETRNWRAKDQSWTYSDLSTLIKKQFLFESEAEDPLLDYLAYCSAGEAFVAPDTTWVFLCLNDADIAAMDETLLRSKLSELTGYDYSDIGTMAGLHTTQLVTKADLVQTDEWSTAIQNRIHGEYRINGLLSPARVKIVNEAVYSFKEGVDLGTLPTEPPTAVTLTEGTETS